MTLFSTPAEFIVRLEQHGQHFYAEQGTPISLEFADGKGVSARLANVSVAPGGTPFSIICTSDGRMPDVEPAEGAQMTADAIVVPPGGDSPLALVTLPEEQLTAIMAERDEARRVLDEQGTRCDEEMARALDQRDAARREVEKIRRELADELRRNAELEKARNEWRRNSRSWEAQYHTLSDVMLASPPSDTPKSTRQQLNDFVTATTGRRRETQLEKDVIVGAGYSIGGEVKKPRNLVTTQQPNLDGSVTITVKEAE